MDNCDLEKLAISGVKLHPEFTPQIRDYRATVDSNVNKVKVDLRTSDCGASFRILFGDGSGTINLVDGLSRLEIEVMAEDGTRKTYCVEITKLSAKVAELEDLTVEGDAILYPPFSSQIHHYYCSVPFHRAAVTPRPVVPDKNMKVSVNGGDASREVPLNFGDTMVQVSVSSADGSNSLMYSVLVTRDLMPVTVTFADSTDALQYECPVSLNALYRPVSINNSRPKHIFSRPYIEMLARRSKMDPLSQRPLGESWRVTELDLDAKMSAAPVKCIFAYRGCDSVMKLSALGSHTLDCPHRPTGELETKDVTETDWYKNNFASSGCFETETKHAVEARKWEKRLQTTVGRKSVDELCALAEEQRKLYAQRLPKPGDSLQYDEDQSPLSCLQQAAAHYASAIGLNPAEARLHFLLGLTLEEQHYATEMYGLQKTADMDSDELCEAKSAALRDDILAVCKLHGFSGAPTVAEQLQALDKELHQLKDQGQSSKADYVQTLYIWLSKRTGKDGSAAVQNEETHLHRALVKYLDAWSLRPHSWEYNLHVGRLLLLQGRSREALLHLQSGLAQRPLQPALRFFMGLALLQQEQKASEDTQQEAARFLQQGLEHFIGQRCRTSGEGQDPSDPLSSINTHFLRGLLTLGELLQRNKLQEKAMSADLVYHIAALLAAQAVSRCVCRGEVSTQLEWVLLDAHFALLQRLIQQRESGVGVAGVGGPLLAKRCLALSALLRLTSIAHCQELLDMQEKVCQVAVVTNPRDSHALCLLGLAQLARYDSDPTADRSEVTLADACLSFQASIELEDKPQRGQTPEQLRKQRWWQEKTQAEREQASPQPSSTQAAEKQPAPAPVAGRGAGRGRGAPGRGSEGTSKTKVTAHAHQAPNRGGKTAGRPSRGRAGAAAKPDGPAKPPNKSSVKSQLPSSKATHDGNPSPVKTEQEPTAAGGDAASTTVNPKSHVPRLGLARALSHSAHTQDQAKQLYRDVIAMAPEVHDAYIELARQLEPSDPQAAVEVYCSFPLKPVAEQSYDDAFITGEIIRVLMMLELYEHPLLGPSLVAYGKIMGLSCIEKYIDILDEKSMTRLLRSIYAMIHDRPEDDPQLELTSSSSSAGCDLFINIKYD